MMRSAVNSNAQAGPSTITARNRPTRTANSIRPSTGRTRLAASPSVIEPGGQRGPIRPSAPYRQDRGRSGSRASSCESWGPLHFSGRVGHLACYQPTRSEEHTSELQSLAYLVCRLLLEKTKKQHDNQYAMHTLQQITTH